MTINSDKILRNLYGDIIKNTFNPNKKELPITLGDLIIFVLTTESAINPERNAFREVNKKEGPEKFDDYKLGLKIQGECDLDKDDIIRIKKLSHFLDTELYGILHTELENGVPFKEPIKPKK